ncbi:FAR1 (predicted) [Pycnogonum litorale]
MLSIPEFYDGQSILITGGTGFMGKVLIEKILRSCPRVSQVFLLMRSKREVPIRERLKKLTESKLFDRIKQISPECLEKLKAIHSDMMKPNLGLSEEDLKLLKSEVSIIFHSAATVKFNEPLRTSILMNVGGTHQLLKIAQEMPKLLVSNFESLGILQIWCYRN